MQFSSNVLSRRLKAGSGGTEGHMGGIKKGAAPKTGAPGPRGGTSQLSPLNKKKAGSMFKPNPSVGRTFKALHRAKNPR